MKNYYDVLGLPSFEDSQDAIFLAYKNGTKRLREVIYTQKDVEMNLILLNEAFLVLSDIELKQRYDYSLSSKTNDENLITSLSDKHDKARIFIRSKLDQVSPKKRKTKFSAILCGFCLLYFLLDFLLGLVTEMHTCTEASSNVPSQEIGVYNPSKGWNQFEIANSFSIQIPETMELREDYDPYTQLLRNNLFVVNNADAVFQQLNLSELSTEAYGTYCRVLIKHYEFSPGKAEHHNQASDITDEDKDNLRKAVDAELGAYSYVEFPTYQWLDISGTKALEAKYKRTGDKGSVVCRLYLLPNYDEMVKMIVSYRESESDFWKSDLENVIRTFKWNNPK